METLKVILEVLNWLIVVWLWVVIFLNKRIVKDLNKAIKMQSEYSNKLAKENISLLKEIYDLKAENKACGSQE